jgi:hypothetical protein
VGSPNFAALVNGSAYESFDIQVMIEWMQRLPWLSDSMRKGDSDAFCEYVVAKGVV